MADRARIEYKRGDVLQQDAEALVNSVNCVGVMGRGVALQFKRAFPGNFKAYQIACRHGDVRPGRMLVYETGKLTNPRFIINFPTKRHWRGRSRLEDIESGLLALVQVIQERGIKSIALPPLGSGLGGLDWKLVKARIQAALSGLRDVNVTVFEPQPAGAIRPLPHGEVPKMTPGRAALLGLMNAYLRALMDPALSLLEVHKLMYFMQEAGERLRLRFVKAPYGPYAENLRHVLQAVEGHYVEGYVGVDAPTTHLNLLPGAIEDAEATLESSRTTRDRFQEVAALVEGFETSHGLELLATVHWLMKHQGLRPRTLDEVINQTHAWDPRKARFTDAQIAMAVERLASKGWIEPPLPSGSSTSQEGSAD
jgi:O-acetyl-ADP-ribose deacetylase (regulator of RNase III)